MAPWGHIYVNPGLTEPYKKGVKTIWIIIGIFAICIIGTGLGVFAAA